MEDQHLLCALFQLDLVVKHGFAEKIYKCEAVSLLSHIQSLKEKLGIAVEALEFLEVETSELVQSDNAYPLAIKSIHRILKDLLSKIAGDEVKKL